MKLSKILLATAGSVAVTAVLLGCSSSTTAQPVASVSPSLQFRGDEIQEGRQDVTLVPEELLVLFPKPLPPLVPVRPGSSESPVIVKRNTFLRFVEDPPSSGEMRLTCSDETIVNTSQVRLNDGTWFLLGIAVRYGTVKVTATSPDRTSVFYVKVSW